jgi:3-deoxy-D-manno-octulosonate 8-phosphate phosphatase (KDO 8-P phosphatase)
MNYPQNVIDKAQCVKLLILDVDGVFTNGQVWLTGSGDEYKVFHTQDGYGIKHIQRNGIDVAVISGRNSPSCALRMKELCVEHVHQGTHDKVPVFEALLKKLNLKPEQCGYVGDDVPDIPVMQRVGLKVAVANATEPVKDIADWITTLEGGHGAVRQVCDLLTHAQQMKTHYVT